MRFARVGIALVFAVVADLACAEDRLVYFPLVTDGAEYRRISYPVEAGAIHVLADTPVVIEARRAPVAYWPITREFLPDLAKASEPVVANLEITGTSASLVEPELYIVWHPEGVTAGPAEIVLGEAATTLYKAYVRDARLAADRTKAYQRLAAQHQALVEAWVKLAGERRGQDMPPTPAEFNLPPPAVYRGYATEPAEAVVLTLPAGSYSIRLRTAGGEVVPESERSLISFGPVDQGIGYFVRPESRWTQPLTSFDTRDVIYTTGATDLFLQPVPTQQFPAASYSHLFYPQSVAVEDSDAMVWVPRSGDDAVGESAFILWDAGKAVETTRPTGFRVQQTPNMSRGYSIETFSPSADSSLVPDFSAIRISSNAHISRIAAVDTQGEAAPSGGEREIRVIVPPRRELVFAPALLPLALGLALRSLVIARRRKWRSHGNSVARAKRDQAPQEA